MDKTLIDYNKNLEELEREREKLKIVIQEMGKEWEESGAGIGWLGSAELSSLVGQGTSTSSLETTTTIATNHSSDITINDITNELVPEEELLFKTTLRNYNSLFSNTVATGPSSEYLQSLLNVNEALLAQSLANHATADIPSLTPAEEQQLLMLDNNITTSSNHLMDDSSFDTSKDNTTIPDNTPLPPRQYYMGSIDPESEAIVSPLSSGDRKQQKKVFDTAIIPRNINY